MRAARAPLPGRLVVALVVQDAEAAWAALTALVSFEVSAWLGVAVGAWAILAAVACSLTPRKRKLGVLLSATLQTAVAALGLVLLIGAPDVRLLGGAYGLVGMCLLATFLVEGRRA